MMIRETQMRMTLLTSAALLGLAYGPALAQNTTSSTMSPPSPNANAGAATRMAPGNNVGSSTGPAAAMPMSDNPADTGMTGMRPMRGQMGQGAGDGPHGRMMHGRMMRGHDMADEADMSGMGTSRGRQYRGGAGSPSSTRASNIDQADTRSGIAPRLPDPAAAANTPEGYLAAAQRALASGKTGAAQEALERAETRVLSRSTEPSMAASPADMPMVQQIGAARRALAGRDMAAAKAAISAAMGNGS